MSEERKEFSVADLDAKSAEISATRRQMEAAFTEAHEKWADYEQLQKRFRVLVKELAVIAEALPDPEVTPGGPAAD